MSTMKPTRKFTKPIAEFPTPSFTTDVCSWFGLVNQVAYVFSLATTMAPFRDLLQPFTNFTWTTEHQEAFQESKQIIIEQINQGVEIFEKDRPTCITTDWSQSVKIQPSEYLVYKNVIKPHILEKNNFIYFDYVFVIQN